MFTRYSPGENPRRDSRRPELILLAAFLIAGCHPGSEEARQLRDACADGTAAACADFGQRLLTGQHVLKDEAGAARSFEQACTGGVGTGCASLGLILQTSRLVKRDSARAQGLFRQACDGGAMQGCTQLGLLLRVGAGIAA
ncbi:MAG: tetratricopeptide repeat protein, partial [Gemmatimonadales bacterium]